MSANIRYDDDSCPHPKELYIFYDGNGFFWMRPCSKEKEFLSLIQHDKVNDIRSAVSHQQLKMTLCNFHSLNAFRIHIGEDNLLKMYLRPLETGFKYVMRSCNSTTR